MAIRRTALPFERDFTQVPNEWLRDKRLTRRARGLLAELMSHRVGWRVTTQSLEASGPEGRVALKSALDELKQLGYLRVEQSRDTVTNRFQAVEYVLCDPNQPARTFSASGSPAGGTSTLKKTSDKEHQRNEDEFLHVGAAASTGEGQGATSKQIKLLAELWTLIERELPSEDELEIWQGLTRLEADAQIKHLRDESHRQAREAPAVFGADALRFRRHYASATNEWLERLT